MNVEMQCCGLILDLLLIYFFLRHETVGLYSERLFRMSLVVNTVCIVLDILSVFAIIMTDILPAFVVALVGKLYLVSLVAASFMGFLYTSSGVQHLRDSETFNKIIKIIFGIGALFVLLLPISFFRDGRVVYSYGLSAVATYIFAPFFIIWALVLTFSHGKYMSKSRRNAIRAWMSLEILAATLQFIFPKLLLVGFGSSIGLFILYCELESPEAFLDRTTGIFSFDTMVMYLRQLFSSNRKFTAIMICTEDEWKMDNEQESRILLEMSEFLHSFPGAKLFRSTGHDFMI